MKEAKKWLEMTPTSLVEVNDTETPVLYVFNKDWSNQVTTDYKEHINAYKPSTR